ncbi:hypothetical protein L218DRAFT_722426 [Marasmius fiardii PR-910]|nr:hypothetical protein L218DRAFT_722426 [Marasmius fiardii PR-910]
MSAQHYILSPLSMSGIRGLPPEILQDIFLYAVNGTGENAFGVYGLWVSVAFRISAVCSRWRYIALDTGRIWTSFEVELHERARYPVSLFLSRSKTLPLSLSIGDPSEAGVAVDKKLLASLVAHSHRWGNVDYHYIYDEECLDMLAVAPSLPLLRQIVCVAELASPRAIHEQQFKKCKNLYSATVRYEFYDRLDVDSLPLDHIFHLAVEHGIDGCFENAMEILKTCGKRLKTFIYGSLPSGDLHCILPAPHTPVHLSESIICHADYLAIELWNEIGIYPLLSNILQSLTLPKVTKILLDGDCAKDGKYEGEWPAAIVDSFLTRSRCNLTSVSLEGIPLSDEDVLAVIRRTPALESLTIRELFAKDYRIPLQETPKGLVQTVTKALMIQLQKGYHLDDTGLFLPRLKQLRLRVHAHFDADLEFVEVVRCRWLSCRGVLAERGLREVSLVVLDRDLDELIYKPLGDLEKDGLRVVVKAGARVVV